MQTTTQKIFSGVVMFVGISAHAVASAPLNGSWCAALLEVQPARQALNGPVLYSLRNVAQIAKAVVFESKRREGGDPIKLKNQPPPPGHIQDVQAIFPALDHLSLSGRGIAKVQRIRGRIEQLEKDITSAKTGDVILGGEIVGANGIREYLTLLKNKAEFFDRDHPGEAYWHPGKFLLSLGEFSMSTAVEMGALVYAPHFLVTGQPQLAAGIAAIAAALLPRYLKAAPEFIAYTKGLFSDEAKGLYEQKYGTGRMVTGLTHMNRILEFVERAKENPEAFTYHGFAVPVSKKFVDEFTGGESSGNDEDVRWMIVDQIFYMDTGLPTLLSFLRVKTSADLNSKVPTVTKHIKFDGGGDAGGELKRVEVKIK